jgi:beta-mannosidase
MGTFRPLHEGWTLAATGPVDVSVVPATVPGCVHTDLLAAGLIPDPYLDDNERALTWIGRTGWEYATTFRWTPGAPGDRVDLVCAGLDTVATVELNGVELGRTANMHRSYRFDARPALRAGDNELVVRFESAYAYAERWRDTLGARPNAYAEPFNFIRKMACNFGWDWGPTLVTAGIWQPIGLQTWSGARLATVRPLVTVEDGFGCVEAHVEVERDRGDAPLTVIATVAGVRAEATVPAGERTAVVSLAVPDPALWWPRGYGEPALYALEVRLGDDAWRRRIGFRAVRVDTAPDGAGTPFTVVVNDRAVFVRGVNWIPDDVFVTRVTGERLAHRLGQAAGANINLLRVWGGGRYESDDFYDLADERGLLVTQDFLFACAAYPEEEPFAAEVAAEAAEQVTRLASHPSLILWTGNNENIWGWHDWGWQRALAGRTWGAGFYHRLLPDVVSTLDPTRPYWPGSPWSGTPDRHPNDPAHGTTHIWDVWNQVDYAHYRDYRPRFVAEFGYQGPPAYATLRRALSDDPLATDSPGMRHHQKAIDGDRKLRRGLDAHFRPPCDFDDWHYLTQLNQARAVTLGVTHFRALWPVCAGSVVWQLNDCWPATSWAAVDGDGRRKPLWHALRKAYADRLLTVQPRDGVPALVAVNDTDEAWRAGATVSRLGFDGARSASSAIPLDVPPRSTVTAPLPPDVRTPDDPRRELLVADAGDARAFWFFAEDRDLDLPAARWAADVEPVDGGVRVTVTARTLLRDLTLFPDRLDPAAEVDDALVTLLPGASATFTVTAPSPLDPVALTSRPVLRAVNDIAVGAPAAG